jgi:tRNA-2-methylthio-N6-dimethylallyladenosine synthase
MRRTYSRERFLDRVALIREHVPDCAITTDIIVGFPGETDADFEETLAVAEEVGFDGAFTFIYSPRRGTEAPPSPTTSSRTSCASSAWSASSR